MLEADEKLCAWCYFTVLKHTLDRNSTLRVQTQIRVSVKRTVTKDMMVVVSKPLSM